MFVAGLTEPSKAWKDTIRLFEVEFTTLHGDSLDKREGIVHRLQEILQRKFPNQCKEAVRLYSRLRTFIRIRHINRKAKVSNKRKIAQKNEKWAKSRKN
jgi:hypothetical protein